MKKLIIIPAFNEAANIGKLLKELRTKMKDFDVVVINDGSMDETSAVCRKERTKVLDLPCNLGIGGAVQTGYQHGVSMGYDVIIQMDGDGQHDPEYLKALVAPVLTGEADIVIGSRFMEKQGYQSSFWRRGGIRFYTVLIRMLTGISVSDPTSGFRAVSREVAAYFAVSYPTDYPEPESIVSLNRLQYRIKEVPVRMRDRSGGKSSIRGVKTVYYMVKVTLAILIDLLKREHAEKRYVQGG
ncbi:glycosyltransferase family 2 protein [Cohnella candidum]|uniref:Glycosyltransferase family 2 protein n=1 Tax=Cohnella candidum TaxID=2674991 RepID=A0A3G3JU20_9BACL|nr:glycosyltransferase family 2 protein [Cohnella candidum]AYQ71387.1 glycosyltransferase family 2 protein [Cohnella candidum]